MKFPRYQASRVDTDDHTAAVSPWPGDGEIRAPPSGKRQKAELSPRGRDQQSLGSGTPPLEKSAAQADSFVPSEDSDNNIAYIAPTDNFWLKLLMCT